MKKNFKCEICESFSPLSTWIEITYETCTFSEFGLFIRHLWRCQRSQMWHLWEIFFITTSSPKGTYELCTFSEFTNLPKLSILCYKIKIRVKLTTYHICMIWSYITICIFYTVTRKFDFQYFFMWKNLQIIFLSC